MSNARTRLPEEIKIVDAITQVTIENAIEVGSGTNGVSQVYTPVGADIITILTDIRTGSIILQKSINNTTSGSWEDLWTNATDGIGSLVLDTSTAGIVPQLRLVGSGVAGSVFADIAWRQKN